MMSRNLIVFISALIFLGSSVTALNCSQNYQCSSVTEDYNFVQCVDNQCTCRSELGFAGSATVNDKCRCSNGGNGAAVYWGNGKPYCKVCEAPKKITYDNGLPYCVDPASCEVLDATATRDAIRREQVKRVYQYLVYPTPAAIISHQLPITDLFDASAKGRVSPVGSFDTFAAVEEYFYGLASTPNSFVQNVAIKSLSGTGDKVGVEVDILFNSTGRMYNLTQMGFFTFNEKNLIISTDLVILNLGAAVDAPVAAQSTVIQQVCGMLTTFPRTCPPEADPAGYYESFEDCVQFMSSIPFGSWNRANSNSVVCRQLHSILTLYRPLEHCPHSGKTGGGHCIDYTYESYFQKDY